MTYIAHAKKANHRNFARSTTDNETVGQRLARLRKERGYTQVELAEKIGIIQRLISDLRDGQAAPVGRDGRSVLPWLWTVTVDDLLAPKTAANRKTWQQPSLKLVRRLEEIEKLPENKQSLHIECARFHAAGAAVAR